MPSGSPCLHEIFERQVLEAPDRPAVSYEGEILSYGELNRRANRIAHFLRARSVGPGQLVGLCLDRSLDTVTAILAVLKAGAAYVPMDPSNPAERVRMIVEDARCPVVIIHETQRVRFSDSDALIVLDGTEQPWEAYPEANPEPVAKSDDLAYVIYTSGSTGRPKGVPIAHRNVTRLFASTCIWFGFSEEDVWTLFHSFAFDFSVWEIWGALLHGGRLVVVPYWISRSPEDFHRLLRDEEVTVLNQTPSAFYQLEAHNTSLPIEESKRLALRYVIFGGEALSFPSLTSWFERHGDDRPQIINMYGITETTIHVTYRRVREHEAVPGTPSYIGIPIPDQPCHVVTGDGLLAEIGEEGELYVGGAGNASGYMNRPELTAERFVPSPFPEDNGAILYKSGDLVRRLEGDMVYLGRMDRQVQLRGFRVELGEIESTLVTFDGVQGAAVRPHATGEGDLRLVAYYVSPSELSVSVLREHMARSLPDYMVPSVFIRIDTMPLTGNGKTDYRALPDPVVERGSAVYIAPRNEIECRLADLWQNLLQIPRVSVEDNFFALGGHSLMATRLLLRINERFGIRLPLRAFHDSPSIAGLAGMLDTAPLGGDTAAGTDLHRAARDQPLPLSFAQERLWFIEHLDPGNTAYVIPILFEIKGPVDLSKLRMSLEAVVSRHEVLRTTFRRTGGALVQDVSPVTEVSFEVVPSGSIVEKAEITAMTRAALSLVAGSPLNLEEGPLARFIYFAHRDDHNFLGLVVHHAIFDGWSISILLDDLAEAYTALDAGESPSLSPLEFQYGDFGNWQRSQYESGALQRHLMYWKQRLAPPLPVLELPTDFPRPPRQTWQGAVACDRVSATDTAKLESLALDQRTTLFTVLLVAWQLLLHRYSGQEEILIGCAIAGRTHPALEAMIGFFVNTVAIRMQVPDQSTFVELLDAANALILDAQEHQDLPFDRVVAEVREEHDPSRSPVFQVMFVLHNTPSYDVSFSGLDIAGQEINNGCAKFDLSLAVQPVQGELKLSLEYNTSLFRAETAERMLRGYETLLKSILQNPGGRLGDFQIVDGPERALLLETWTDTSIALDRSQSLHQLFESRAAELPDCVAVADDETSLTFSELDARANQLAHYLLARGVTPEEPVPFFLGRTVRVMVAIIGILKAGAAYVPLDLLDPPGRRARVLSVLGPRMILTESELAPRLSDTSIECVCLDAPGLLDGFSTDSPGIGASGENLAYVIFTSGSTGDPKGVCCTHQGVINLYQDLQSRLPVGPGEACSIWTAFSFDVSVYESWTSLLAGATLHIIPERVRANPEACLEWLRARDVITGYIPGFMLPTLLETQRRAPLPWRRLLVGVEPLSEALLSDIVEATPGLVLLNLYGPTEAAIYVTLYQAHDTHPRPTGNAPIGTAIQNTRIYVLDPSMNPLPVGVPGELYIGGVGLARGYYQAPELTARQFVPDPFSELDTRRLYRTGDLVYFKDDGNIQFIRRMDRYIKLRGYRIEPGEIESVLREFPGIDDAVVLLNEKGPLGPRLVAYLSTQAGDAIVGDALADVLKARLPAHMCPAQFVPLDRFPRTVQGKLDRKALPVPPETLSTADTGVAPRSDLERAIAAHWQALLGVADAGTRDNFFRLGGDSLVLIQLASRIREQFQVELPLRLLLESPTIEAQARALEHLLAAGRAEGVTDSIPVADRDKPLPLSFAQEQLWFIEQLQPGSTAYHIPLLITIAGELNPACFVEALRMLAQRHEALRTAIAADAGTPTQKLLASLDIPVSIVDAGETTDETDLASIARSMLSEAARETFDLATGPLCRLTLLKAGPERWFALFVVHHIIFDGWSIRVLLEDWSELYAALAEKREPDLPVLTVQQADHAAWQHHYLDTPAYHDQIAYWKSQLAGAPPVHELPVDFPRPIHQTWSGALAEGWVDVELSGGIIELARDRGKSLFTLLFSAWGILMERYTGQHDAVIGTALSGRHRQELEPLLGMFVHTVALRTQADRDRTMDDYLEHVEAIIIEAQEHQEAPFERVVAALLEERDPGRSPLFQVVFVLDEMLEHEVRAGGLTLTVESVHNDSAKFDLTMNVSQLGSRLKLSLEYNTSLFRAATAERMLRGYETLLKSILQNPGGRLGDFQIVDGPERTLLLETWTDTAFPLDRSQSLHQLFESRTAELPDCVAVADDETSLTFSELDARANQLAHYLLARGVTPEEPVPFFLGRTVRVMVAIIGILKAGAAYVPLDLLDPPGRRARVLSVLTPRLILTEDELAPQLSDTAMECVCLDAPGLLEGFSVDSPSIGASGEHLAYVIFTSGSTGDPKGVCCTHQGVINLYQDLQARLPVGPGDACSIWTAFSFDVSVYESWTSLLAGATLHIIPERVRANPDACLEWLRAREVVTGYIPGFMLPTLLETQRRAPLPWRRLLVGVEPLSEALLSDIVEATPGLVLLNLYGPTEAAIYVTLYQAHDTHPRPTGNAPIGKAIQNTRIYILDPSMNPLPVGVPGELYIGGVGLARGYYNAPELTARQFVPDPFTELDTKRLYRTGDLVYFKDDGNIQFIRRMDRYIKLRGYRIEPGEIESILREFPGIDDAVVLLNENGPLGPRLVAYLATGAGDAIVGDALADFLKARLPAHMCPAQFVPLARFPRTVQGKLDRKALPEPSLLKADEEESGPRNECEKHILEIWRSSLETESRSVHTDFFVLGGHSLLAVKMLDRINRHLGGALTLSDFFDNPTIAGLAEKLGAGTNGDVPPRGIQLREVKPGHRIPFFCLPGAGDSGGIYDAYAEALSADQPFFGFANLDSEESGPAGIEQVARRCIEEMKKVRPSGPYYLGGFSFGGTLAYEMARQLIEAGEEVPFIAIIDGATPDHFLARAVLSKLYLQCLVERGRARCHVFARTWKLHAGYLRDGIGLFIGRAGQRRDSDHPPLRLAEYLRWIWVDASVQYYFIQAGLSSPTLGERRVDLFLDQIVRSRTKTMRSSRQAIGDYRMVPIPAEITLFRAQHNPYNSERRDPTYGWGRYALKGLRIVEVPGNHMAMIRPPYATGLGQALQRMMDELESRRTAL